jgi:hypothetical protein
LFMDGGTIRLNLDGVGPESGDLELLPNDPELCRTHVRPRP